MQVKTNQSSLRTSEHGIKNVMTCNLTTRTTQTPPRQVTNRERTHVLRGGG